MRFTLDGWRDAEGGEEQGVVAEDPAHSHDEGPRGHSPFAGPEEPHEAADAERDAYREEGGQGVHPGVQEGEAAPDQDREQGEEDGGHTAG